MNDHQAYQFIRSAKNINEKDITDANFDDLKYWTNLFPLELDAFFKTSSNLPFRKDLLNSQRNDSDWA